MIYRQNYTTAYCQTVESDTFNLGCESIQSVDNATIVIASKRKIVDRMYSRDSKKKNRETSNFWSNFFFLDRGYVKHSNEAWTYCKKTEKV